MIVESVIVDTIDKARIECDLFRGSYVVKLKGMLETPQIIVVLGSWHRGEQLADDAAFGGKCGGSALVSGRLRLRKFSLQAWRAIQSTREPCQVSGGQARIICRVTPPNSSGFPAKRHGRGEIHCETREF